MAGVVLKGIGELSAKLRKNTDLGPVRQVVQQNGSEMQSKAQRNAPVDTGTLKRSIELEISDGGLTATSAPTAEYAPYVEHGTRYQEAQPYMKPAFNVQKEKFKRDIDKLTK